MNLVTIIWSCIASACLTLAAMNLLVWVKMRTARANPLISLMAAASAVTAFFELSMMLAKTPLEYGRFFRWIHLPLWVIVVSLVLFIRQYLRAGRPWLAWTVCGLRTLSLILNFSFTPNLHYREISSLQPIRFLGETIYIAQGARNPWMLTAQMSTLLLVIYVLDAAIAVHRRHDSRSAVLMSSAIIFWVVASMIQIALIFWWRVPMPLTISFFSLGLVFAVAYEMTREVQRAAQLSDDLRKSESRMRDITFSMGEWVWETDARGVYTYSSANGDKLFGHVIGKTPFDLMASQEAGKERALYSELAARKAPIRNLEYWSVARNGERICLLTNGVPILTEAGGLAGYLGVSKDITERKRAEESLKESEAALRNSKRDLQLLAGRLISAQEEELRRLSRELHDDLTQRLAVTAIEAGKMELAVNKLPGQYAEIGRAAAQIKEQLIQVAEDVHKISRQIHPAILDDLGLVRAIESECASVMGRHPVRITFRKERVPDEIPNNIALCLYRVIQEGLRNVTAHSAAENCEVYLKGDDHALSLTVSDDGIGFDPLEARRMPGLGLASMRERVQLIQGEFAIRPRPGSGAVITVRVPLAGGSA